MKRKIYEKLVKWKEESKGHTAMLIQGAHRVGKTHIAEEFARENYRSYILIDFEKADKTVKGLFDDLSDIPLLLQTLSRIEHVTLYERESLVIFDNVQTFPRARESIKFMVADGRYDFLETGVLATYWENVKDIIIPSEEEQMTLFPMDFEEFCWALGDETTVPTIRSHFETLSPLSDELHKSIMTQFVKYMLVGGMPESVKEYAETLDFHRCECVKSDILDSFRQEIASRSRKPDRNKTMALFDAVPSELMKRDRTFVPRHVDPNGRIEKYEGALLWLKESHICSLCQKADFTENGPFLHAEYGKMKCYMGDTGLLITHCINDDAKDDVYPATLTGDLNVRGGMFTENIVAQILRSNGHELLYHTFYTEGSKNLREVDFLIRRRIDVCPIEVRPGRSDLHASLDRFIEIHPGNLGQAYILHSDDVRMDGDVALLPAYMVICL